MEQQRLLNAITTALWSFTIGFAAAFATYKVLDKTNDKSNIVFVWNDDEESIPVDGSLITLEFTDGNTVYIGPYEEPTSK